MAAAIATLRSRVLALQVLVSVLALAGVAWWAQRQDVPSLPSAREAAGPLAGALALYALATLLRGERWHRLLTLGGVHGTRADAYALTTVGYMGNNALPARTGDVIKAMLSAGRADAPRRDAFGALVAERLLDAVALLVVFVGLVAAAGLPLGISRGMAGVLVAAVLLAGVLAALLTRRSRGSAHRAWELLTALLAPTRRLAGPAGAVAFALSLLLWVAEGAVYASLGSVSGVHLNLADGLYVMALANLAAMVPAAPGYVGTFDAAVLLGVRLTGGGAARVALPYVVLVRFVLFVPITLVGLVALLTRYGGLRAARQALSRQATGERSGAGACDPEGSSIGSSQTKRAPAEPSWARVKVPPSRSASSRPIASPRPKPPPPVRVPR
jgi:glycosyltransferase 2 family protein